MCFYPWWETWVLANSIGWRKLISLHAYPPYGWYLFLRCLFGISSAAEVFQKRNDQLNGILRVYKWSAMTWALVGRMTLGVMSFLKCIWHELFPSVFESPMCTKNDTKLKTCLKFLKTSFFAGKRPYFSLQNCRGDWDWIYCIVTSIDLIALPRTQCFCYKSPQNVDIVQQYRGSFRNFQDLQWGRKLGEKIELS